MIIDKNLLALSNTLSKTQLTINKIIQTDFAGHRDQLQSDLSKVMAVISILEHDSKISLEEIRNLTKENMASIMDEIEYEFKINPKSPESIRREFKIVK